MARVKDPETVDPAAEALIRGEATPEEQAETAAARKALELAPAGDATLPARHRYDATQVAVIKGTVAPNLTDIELAWFLEVSARYRLDPLLKEVFAAKFDGKNLTIFTGRDGMLKAARHTGKLLRMSSHVVRKEDEFVKTIDTEASEAEGRDVLHVHHKQEGMGEEKRGAIVGAYALVWTTDSPYPWYAEATWEEYGADRQELGGKPTLWKKGQKGYPEAMMRKVPESIALKLACGLSGLTSEAEVAKQLQPGQGERAALGGEGGAPTVEWPEGEAGALLQALVDRANELTPGSWRDAKVAMELGSASEEQVAKLTEKLRRFIATRSPEDPLVTSVEGTAEEDVPEAEVVEELPYIEWNEAIYNQGLSDVADLRSKLEEDVSEEERVEMEATIATAEFQLRAMEHWKGKPHPENDGGGV